MEPVIALVGRPNVGKSTLFNFLTRTRDALVADYPGLTRDRKYGRGKIGPRPYIVVDTGGIGEASEGIELGMHKQAWAAVGEANVILFLVDARAGLSAADEQLAGELRRLGKPLHLVVNKTDGLNRAVAAADFHSLGLGEPKAIAASHGTGVAALMEQVLEQLPEDSGEETGEPLLAPEEGGSLRIAIVGRPNVGKSTLVNRMLGEERVLVFDMPGTTRDSIFIPFEREGVDYTLIDTAGVRRRGKIRETVEKFSVVKTMQAIEAAHVVILVIDGSEGVTDQDAGLIGHVMDAGRALVVAVNKWDNLESGQRDQVKRLLDVKLGFLDFARIHFISALHGSGVGNLFDSVRKAYDAAMRDLPTPLLNEILEDAITAHQPPIVRGRRIKMRYAHQGGQNPPIIVIHGNQVDQVPKIYQRYLVNVFRRELDLYGTPVRVEFRVSANPYEGRKNPLTERQIARRRRLMKFVKSKK